MCLCRVAYTGRPPRRPGPLKKSAKVTPTPSPASQSQIPGGPFPSSSRGKTEQLLLTGENDLESTGVARERHEEAKTQLGSHLLAIHHHVTLLTSPIRASGASPENGDMPTCLVPHPRLPGFSAPIATERCSANKHPQIHQFLLGTRVNEHRQVFKRQREHRMGSVRMSRVLDRRNRLCSPGTFLPSQQQRLQASAQPRSSELKGLEQT